MRRTFVAVTLAAGIVGFACDPATEITPPRSNVVDLGDLRNIGLVTEPNCGGLVDWLQREAAAAPANRGWNRGGDEEAAPVAGRATTSDATASSGEDSAQDSPQSPVAGTGFSTTNVQEAGVDEPDIVKTDGRRLIAIANGRIRFVDLTGERAEERAVLMVPGAHGLLLAGDRVLVIASEATYYPMPGRVEPMPAPDVGAPDEPDVAVDDRAGVAIAPIPGVPAQTTRVTVIDIADLGAPAVESELELEGGYVAARLAGGVARLVLRSTPKAVLEAPADAKPSSDVDDWMPAYTYRERNGATSVASGALVACDQVHHPEGSTGVEMVTVVAVDPQDPRPGQAATVAGAGQTVYASEDRLYVTSPRWGGPTEERAGPATEIHAFDISDKVASTYAGSGVVDGVLLNQFSMSEHDGVLRVAATAANGTTGESESHVATFRVADDTLTQLGSVGGLGKTERIYAVRFIGPMGYVVTFRETDPLYVIDLSDPARPTQRGELKIPGYSAYLHPITDGRLLGIGQNATDQGRRLGAQVSLFDVSDPMAPEQVATHDLGAFGSSVEHDHHAFLWWAKSKLAVIPVAGGRCLPGQACASFAPGAVGLTVDGDRFVELGRVEHPTRMPVTRSLVVGGELLTLSESGLLSSDIATLGSSSWLPF